MKKELGKRAGAMAGVSMALMVMVTVGNATAGEQAQWPTSGELASLAKTAGDEEPGAIRRWMVAGQDITSWTEAEETGTCKRVAVWVSARPKGVQNYRYCGGSVESLGTPGSPVRSPAMTRMVKGLVQKAVLSGEASMESDGFRFEAKRKDGSVGNTVCAVDLTVRSAQLVAVKSTEDGCQ